MILYYILFLLMGLLSYGMLESKKKSLTKTKRHLIDRDHWDFLFWKIGIVIGFCGSIGMIIELIKYLLDY